MKKIVTLLGIVSLAILLGGCSLFQKGGLGQAGKGVTGQGPFTGSLQAAIKLGVPMKCTYKIEDQEMEGWIKGQQYRGKVKNQEGKTGEVLMKDNCMWAWSEDEGKGVKMCFDLEEGKDMWDPEAWGMEGEEYQDMAPPDVEYHCVPTVVTDAKFNPPDEVEFMDLTQMMEGMMQGMDAETIKQMEEGAKQMEESMPSQEEMDQMKEQMEGMMENYGGEQ